MALTPAYANVELIDGTIYEDVRITFADRLRYEATAKARGWQPDKQPMTGAGFLAWAALTRTGRYTGSYAEFCADVVDVQLDDTAAAPDTTADPTQPDHLDAP